MVGLHIGRSPQTKQEQCNDVNVQLVLQTLVALVQAYLGAIFESYAVAITDCLGHKGFRLQHPEIGVGLHRKLQREYLRLLAQRFDCLRKPHVL